MEENKDNRNVIELNEMNLPENEENPEQECKQITKQKKLLERTNTSDNNSNNSLPMDFWNFLLMLIILAIPVINFIALIRWSISKNININKRNLSRAILLLVILALVFYLSAPHLVKSIFTTTDQPSTWAKTEITEALELGLIDEEAAAYYSQEITREEMVELAVRAYEKTMNATAKQMSPNPFSDTNNIAVLKAAQLNIISSSASSVTEFRPLSPVDRQTMAVILLNTAKAARPNIEWKIADKTVFTDAAEIDNWAIGAIHFAFNHNIIKAHDNHIAPHILVNREEAIVCIKRLYKLTI